MRGGTVASVGLAAAASLRWRPLSARYCDIKADPALVEPRLQRHRLVWLPKYGYC